MKRNNVFWILLLVGLSAGTIQAQEPWDAIADGSFEAGHNVPPWMEASSVGYLIVVNSPGPARTGSWYASFGSPDVMLATASLEQEVTLGSSDAQLEFWYMRPFDAENGEDNLQVFMDGIPIWVNSSELGGGTLGTYTNGKVEIGQFADGQTHTLRFAMMTTGITNSGMGTQWLVDDVSIMTRDAAEFEADFIWAPAFPTWEEEVRFTDTSGGEPDGWSWDFGDGFGSEFQNPFHPYSSAGEYEVTLTVSWSGHGVEDTVNQTVTVLDPLLAFFSWSPEMPLVGETLTFFNGSSGGPDTSSWDFGDGSTSSERHPTHVYSEPGDYIVVLMIGRTADDSSHHTHHTITVVSDLVADFTWYPEAPVVGDAIQLVDASWGNPTSWLWSLPDGTTTTDPSATVTFDEPGAYDVSLTVSRLSDSGTESSSTTLTIDVGSPPLNPDFTWDPATPMVNEVIYFTDLTVGEIASWLWELGDGSTSTVQHPVHNYSAAGAYAVSLEVTDVFGGAARTVRTVTVTEDPYRADFSWLPEQPMAGQEVWFRDLSRGGALAWHWQFGDGATSTEQNPSHRFLNPGIYHVTLTAQFDAGGQLTRSATHAVVVTDVDLDADFVWTPLAPKINEVVRFTDISRGRPTSWTWDFGDGSTSILRNPTHIYRTPGDYTVTLTLGRASDGSSDVTTRPLEVADSVTVDFSWLPDSPAANRPVQFSEQVTGQISGRFWSFGDGATSRQENPIHTFEQPGTYRVSLVAFGPGGAVIAAVRHPVAVTAADLQPAIQVSHDEADIGQEVVFSVTGVDAADRLEWDFGGLSCDGTHGPVVCIPTSENDCLTAHYAYSSPGLKPVRLSVIAGNQPYGPASAAVKIRPGGACSGSPKADFSWWPSSPKVGERVRCVDGSTGPPALWQWVFDDGAISIDQHATHTFTTAGPHTVRLAVSNDNGTSTFESVINVETVNPVCGNGICDPGESSWTCAADCGGAANGTWRAGRKTTVQTVPAAAGGVPGANGTFWVTEGTLVNPNPTTAKVVVEFVPDDKPLVVRSAGPLTIPPRTAFTLTNIVSDLFYTNELGSLWIDADMPVIVNTRTFNRSADGTFGQGIRGTSRTDSLASGEGEVYLVGLRQNEHFRTNLLVQEVDGLPATVVFEVFNHAGQPAASGSFTVSGRSKWQEPITVLGIDYLQVGFARVRVEGEGRLTVLASVVDRKTGDATTVDAVHQQRAEAGSPAKGAEIGDSHYLVAVVARTPGANQTVWRSEISILNTAMEAQQLELRYVPESSGVITSNVNVEAGSLFSSTDVIGEVFPQAADGTGALHVHADGGLVVSSRTYNLLPSDATVGQSIPGLTTGDMARPGEVWLLDSLKETAEFRCNMGFAEYEGSAAEVTVVLFDVNAAAFRYLASKSYTVPPLGQFQVNRVFRDMGLEGQYPQALAYITVSSQGGAVYVYASVVDNGEGDGTTILGKRQ